MAVEAAEPGRGGAAGYTPYHVLVALREASRGPVGRPYLERVLSLGEASTRTLIKRLRGLGLLKPSGRAGHEATEAGRRVANILEYIELREVHEHFPGMPWKPAVAVYTSLLDPPRDLTDVYRIRDYIVMEGCRTVVIGGVVNGNPVFPGLPGDLAATASEAVSGVFSFNVRSTGVIVLAPLNCAGAVVNGLIRLLADLCVGGMQADTA